MQLCLAIEVAQKNCCLVHYDLTPWNIILQRLNSPMTIEYALSYDRVIRVRTSVIPVIIDYGKSHVVYDEIHHGYINMFKVSTIHDVISILVTSIDQIINSKKISILLLWQSQGGRSCRFVYIQYTMPSYD